jgi:hypothetical protein
MAYGFIPAVWRKVKVTVIPKSGELDYTQANAYRPENLSPFLLKTMEKLVDIHIWEGALKMSPLHRNQHTYQISKSTETALQSVVTRSESATEYKDVTLGSEHPFVGPETACGIAVELPRQQSRTGRPEITEGLGTP